MSHATVRSTGLNPNAHGLLADTALATRLGVIEAVRYDWVHNALQDGTFTVEATEFLKSAATVGVTFAVLERFLADDAWRFPKAHKSKAKELHRVFSVWRSSADSDETKIRGSASELLGLYGLLRHFVETRNVVLTVKRCKSVPCPQAVLHR